MEVYNHIGQLLYHHDCVILPDFGGFITNYKSAKIDYINHNFYPPGKDVSFNKNLVINDALLINHLANIENVSYIESKNIVVAFVKKTNKKLNSGETVIFDGIGKFYYDKQRILQFEPDISSNFLLESYGLSSFHFPALDTVESSLGQRKMKFDKSHKPVFIKKKTLKRIAIGVPAILLLSLLNFNSGKISNQFSGLSSVIPLPVINFQEKSNIEIEDNTLIVESEEFIAETIVEEDVIEAPELDAISSSQRFFIIAGSFSEEKNAIAFSQKLKQSNFPSEVLDLENGKFRVVFSGHINKMEALSELRRIRKSVEANAWMLKK